MRNIRINSKVLFPLSIAMLAVVFFEESYLVQRNLQHPIQNTSAYQVVTRVIKIVSSNTEGFEPNVVKLKYGETVKFVFSTPDEAHTFTLPAYGVDQIIPSGKATELVFHATKKGEFVFFCSTPCKMMHNSGILIVS